MMEASAVKVCAFCLENLHGIKYVPQSISSRITEVVHFFAR